MKRIAIALVLALCLVTAGTGAVSAADVGTDDCMDPYPYSVGGSDVSTQGCTPPPCSGICNDVAERQ